jgi:hypothetical protein
VTVGEVDVVNESTGFSTTTTFSVSNNILTVDLHSISNAVRLSIRFRVSDGTNTGLVSIPMGVLLGDVNASGRVDSGDVFSVRQQTGQAPTSSNFRNDVNASGRIDSGDVFAVRQQTGTGLP